MDKLTTGDKVIGISAILLLVFSLLPWFEASVDFGGGDLGIDFSESASENGWGIGFLWAGVPVILGLAMLAYVLISRFSPDTDLPEVAWPQILLGVGVVAALLVVIKLIIGVDENDLLPGAGAIDDEFVDDFLDDLDLSVTRQIGIYLSALAAIGLAVGAFLRMREDQGASRTPPTAF
jgi:hypothetical protein